MKKIIEEILQDETGESNPFMFIELETFQDASLKTIFTIVSDFGRIKGSKKNIFILDFNPHNVYMPFKIENLWPEAFVTHKDQIVQNAFSCRFLGFVKKISQDFEQ